MINFLIEQDKKGQLILERTYFKQKIKPHQDKTNTFPISPRIYKSLT